MTARTRAGPDRLTLIVLAVLFATSGCAALIYQIVWLQLLQLAVGSSAVSVGVLLATFMAGMCAGSLVLPRVISSRQHPIRVYAWLEGGIAVVGLLLLFVLPRIGGLYILAGGGFIGRALVAALCLLLPTAMMGATLPAIARWAGATPTGMAWLGFFYATNIAGAVIGSLAAGFYLLRVYDVGIATYVAVMMNVLAAATAWRLSQRTPAQVAEPAPRVRVTPDANRPAVLAAIALSGCSALICEVIWTRLLSLAIGSTVYTFALILAALLAGLGIGSGVGAAVARRTPRAHVWLAGAQVLLVGAMGWAAFLAIGWLPFAGVSTTSDPWSLLSLDFVRCLAIVLPAAILWGASFPLALAAAVSPGDDPGRIVGTVYAANTAGAIIGSIAGVLIAAGAGSHWAQRLAIGAAALAALVLLLSPRSARPAQRRLDRRAVAAAVGVLVIAVVVAASIPPVPPVLMAYGRHSASWNGQTTIVHAAEGLDAFLAVSRTPTGAPVYHAAGKVQASSEGEDLRLQRMLAHFSHLIPEAPRDVLVIGLGAGATAGAIAIAPGVERVTVVEIERRVPALSAYFADYNYGVADNPKVRLKIDDGRHYVMTTDERFDVITTDLVDPWVKGTAALFTREFFESVKAHLKPGGVVTMFVQLYLSNEATAKSEIATFLDVFPDGMVWGNTVGGAGYDLVLTAQAGPQPIDVDRWLAKLESPAYRIVAESLREIGLSSAIDLLATYAASKPTIDPWLRGAEINRDRNLRLQFLAGMNVDLQESSRIYAGMVQDTRFPADRFTGSEASLARLRAALTSAIERAAASGRTAP
jgi:spermidine synthase